MNNEPLPSGRFEQTDLVGFEKAFYSLDFAGTFREQVIKTFTKQLLG